jgi:uncharacterized protein YjbJ (UPF0337 family)
MLNAQELQGQWNKIRGQVKEKWGQLTDNDLQIENGNIDQLVGRIQQKTGEGREAIEKFLGDLTARGSSVVSQAAETAREFAGNAAGRLREGYGQAARMATDGYETAEDFVRHRPGPSVAAAFGVGLAVGLVVGVALRSNR